MGSGLAERFVGAYEISVICSTVVNGLRTRDAPASSGATTTAELKVT